MTQKLISETSILKIKAQRRSIGLIKFKTRDDQNFSKWYSLTENLVIMVFTEKSNQVSQLRKLFRDTKSSHDYISENKMSPLEAKGKFKDLLSVFISELEINPSLNIKNKNSDSLETSIKISNSQSQNQNVNISVEINNIIEKIKQNEPNPERIKLAESKLKELESEIKNESPTWSKIKDILIWILNFSKDIFLQIIPIILEKYKT